MRSLLLGSLLAASFVFVGTAQAVPSGGLPDQVCSGPAAAHNPNCGGGGVVVQGLAVVGDDAGAVPEPGAAALFALGAGLVAARSRRRAAN
jgi:hypothetical protein